MRPDEIRSLYDPGYVGAYDERFLTGPPWAALGARFEVELIGELLDDRGSRWLDVACGTGWFLSQFPAVERTGLDLSPAMVELARERNPGADIAEGSYLEPHDAWVGGFDLVSCMWFAYAYVDTVDQVEDVVANLARWTAPGGTVFLPVCDLVDLTGGTDVTYLNTETWTFGGPLRIEAFVWSWLDDQHGKLHRRLICPHLLHLVEVLGRWFRQVQVVHYPPLQPGWGGRRALVARGRRAADDDGAPVEVTERRERYRPDPDLDALAAAAVEVVEGEIEPTDAVAFEAPARGSVDGEPPSEAAADQRGVWSAWFRLPLPMRRTIRRAWATIPVSLRAPLGRAVAPARSSDDGGASGSDLDDGR
ncbi:MAG: class I SAM-dependent methyltransferase [Acidimicrobiales bacterium]|nr:class I SAM-dependent methyltransferase [Acidimicrobiales bacterium]